MYKNGFIIKKTPKWLIYDEKKKKNVYSFPEKVNVIE